MKKLVLLLVLSIFFVLSRRPRSPVSAKGKVVLVTGASSGIGRATAHCFAAQGARLAITARRLDVLQNVKAELAPYSIDVLIIQADLTNDDELERIVRSTLETYGQIDVLINNAGCMVGGSLLKASPQKLRHMLDLNLYGLIRLTQLVIPAMLEQGSGHIINVSSVAGAILGAGQIAYAASKGGVNSFTHALRRELAGSPIRVSLVMPGWTDTQFLKNVDRKEMYNARLTNIFFPIHAPEVMAQTILDVMRYNHQTVIHSGLGFWFASLVHRLSPTLMDWIYRLYFDKPRMMRLFETMG